MAEIVAPQNVENPGEDPRWLGMVNSVGMLGAGPGLGFGYGFRPWLESSDVQAFRTKDRLAADARDAARANPFGRSALRVTTDAIVGKELTLFLAPDAKALGVTPDEAEQWAEMVELMWNAAANSPACHFDAQRKQTFTGLMRTAYQEFYTGGECLGVAKWKQSSNGQRTCVYLVAAERLSDPHGVMDYTGKRRMGVERDSEGAPIAYHIRQKQVQDSLLFGPPDKMQWWRIPRYNTWGRQNIFHYFEQDRVDMTRGISSFTTALLPMRLLQDYITTELESAAIRATYAAVIESELDYDQAMKVIGSEYANAMKGNPLLDFTMRMMTDRATFYRGQDFHFGKSKVSHLLPNEELKMVQGNVGHSQLKDFSQTNLQILASALGVAYESLTKDYSSTNYSGARAALYDVWRSYEVQREGFIRNFAWPIFVNWLEEMIALRGVIPMLGTKNFYEVRDSLAYGTFETWAKPRLDPHHETNADISLFNNGALTLRDLTRTDGNLDWRRTLRVRAQEKAEMERLGLKPEDINWTLLADVKKADAAQTAADRPVSGQGSVSN
jgi:lambda family phage portal protein